MQTNMIPKNKPEDAELYLVDGSGFIFRAYFALAYGRGETMTNPNGTPVGAVYGFTNMILKMLRDYDAPYMAVIFDAGRVNFRNDIYPEYKANRNETPEDLKPQFPLVRDATNALDLPAIELDGYEADDLIAAYTKLARAQGKNVVIVSSDKDLMQLVGPGVRMLDPMKQKWIGPDEVMEKFGVTPDKVVDVQALAGDSSDNVPGVPGIGVKTAVQLINEYGDLESLLSHAQEIKQPKRREALIENAELARISKRLVKLDENAPVPVALEDLKTHSPEKPKLTEFLQKQGFNSILKRLGSAPSPSTLNKNEVSQDKGGALANPQDDMPPIKDNEYVLINDEAILQMWINEAYEEGTLCIDTETTSLTPAKADLIGISLCIKPGRAAYIPLGHVQGPVDLLDEASNTIAQLSKSRALELLKAVLEDKSIIKIAHNMKYDWQLFAKEGVFISPCDDTMLISYVLDGTSHRHSMNALSELYLNHAPIKFEEIAGKGKKQVTFDRVSIEKALPYAAEDADITLRLYKILKPRLAHEKMVSVYENIDRPLIPVIAQMELEGIKIDPLILKNMSAEFAKKLNHLEGDIYKLAGREFNIASPKQMSTILFDELGLKGGKKTKSGDWSTSASVLEKLALEGQTIVEKILEWRSLAKLKSTYTDTLQEQINPKTGRVHTSFAMAHTNTGRLASSDPNLQNIPIRTEEGRKIRKAFIPEKGYILLSVDYSQVELRLAAALAKIDTLIKAFKEGIDIHTLTASQVFDTPLDDITSDLRRSAKAVNFGILYGISGWGLAKHLGCDPGKANKFIQKYLANFSELQNFMDKAKEEARTNGFIRTHHGRKCFISGINEKNSAQRAFAERQAINAPLQGTAADIMKIAMARIPAALKAAGLNAKMLLQVHDELVFEVPEDELEKTEKLVKNVMENVVDIGVPLEAESGSGQNWADAH